MRLGVHWVLGALLTVVSCTLQMSGKNIPAPERKELSKDLSLLKRLALVVLYPILKEE